MEVGALSIALQTIGGDAVASALGKVRTELQKTGKDGAAFDNVMASLKGTLVKFASGLTVGAVLTKIIDETSNAQFATAQLEATLKSTKMVAGQSAEALNAHAEALARMSIYDDDAISGAQSLLLTFTKIRGATFSEATQAVLNVATAMGTDLKSAAIQVGKALNDPILGVTALSRSGIQFTEQQKAMIQKLVESNRLMDAQKLILAELETQFGGSAEAARDTMGGALKALGNAFGNLFEISDQNSRGIVEAINNISDALASLNDWISSNRIGQKFGLVFKGIAAAINPSKSAEFGMALAEFNSPFRGAGGGVEWGGGKTQSDQLTGVPVDWEERAREFDKWFADYQEKKRTMARDALALRNIANVTKTAAIAPAMVTDINLGAADNMRAAVRNSMTVMRDSVHTELAEQAQGVQKLFAQALGSAIGNGIAAAFEVGLATKSIGQAFKALTGTILSSFGSMLVQFGTNALIASKAIQRMFDKLFMPGPQSILAASAIIAIGASLMAAGRGITSGVQAGGGGGGYMAGGGMGVSGPITLPGLTFGPTAATTGATMAPRSNIAVTVIGPNDPSAQRQIQELIRNADRRGGTTTV